LRDAIPPRLLRPFDEARTSFHIASGKLSRAVFPPQRPATSDLYIHVGCGEVNHPKFVNVDGMPHRHIHYVRAIDNLAPIDTDSAALLYASHCLEHFPMAEIPRILAEWRRVLRPGGILRLSVPDFDRLLVIYNQHGEDIETILSMLLGGQDRRYNFHHAVFTKRSLTKFLDRCGFRDVREWRPGSSELTTFDDWSGRKVIVNGVPHEVSLNLESIK
jgi:predicted SAM-dependent methyltransferase